MIIDLLQQLIAIPSYVDKNNDEKKLGEFIFSFFNKNFPWFKIQKQKVTDSRFNLIASDGYKPKLIFLCHLDTVKPTDDFKKMLIPKITRQKNLWSWCL